MSFVHYYNSSKKHLAFLSVTLLSFCDVNNLFSALFFTFSLDSELEKEIWSECAHQFDRSLQTM